MNKESYIDRFFKFDGNTIARKEYIFIHIAMFLITMLVAYFGAFIYMGITGENIDTITIATQKIAIFVGLLLFYPMTVIEWKRVKDAGITKILFYISFVLGITYSILEVYNLLFPTIILEYILYVLIGLGVVILLYFCCVPSKKTKEKIETTPNISKNSNNKNTLPLNSEKSEDIELLENNEVQYYPVKASKLILMSFVTLSLYNVYWFYRNWEYIKKTFPKYKKIMAPMRAIFSPIFYHSFLKHFFPKESGFFTISLFLGFLLLNIFSNAEGILGLTYIFLPLPLLPVVYEIERRNNGLTKEKLRSLKSYRFNIVNNIFIGIFILPVMYIVLAMSFLIPNYTNVPGMHVYSWQTNFLIKNEIILPDETVEFLYSDSFLSYRDSGSIVTDIGVIYFWKDHEDSVYIYRSNYENIASIIDSDTEYYSKMIEIILKNGETEYIEFDSQDNYEKLKKYIETKITIDS